MELKPLTRADFVRILSEPEFNLVRQQIELLQSERLKVTFTKDALDEIARGMIVLVLSCIYIL